MRTLFAALFCLLLAGCSASTVTTPGTLLSDETLASRDGHLTARVPRGWFAATEESLATGAILWLVRDDLGAGVAVNELRLDAATAQLVRERGLAALGAASRSLRGLRPQGNDAGCEETDGACSYLVSDSSGGVRGKVVVFSRGTRFYECELVFLRPAAAAAAGEAFRLQEAFVAALKAAATSS